MCCAMGMVTILGNGNCTIGTPAEILLSSGCIPPILKVLSLWCSGVVILLSR